MSQGVVCTYVELPIITYMYRSLSLSCVGVLGVLWYMYVGVSRGVSTYVYRCVTIMVLESKGV